MTNTPKMNHEIYIANFFFTKDSSLLFPFTFEFPLKNFSPTFVHTFLLSVSLHLSGKHLLIFHQLVLLKSKPISPCIKDLLLNSLEEHEFYFTSPEFSLCNTPNTEEYYSKCNHRCV